MSQRIRGRDRLIVAIAALALLTVGCGGATDEEPSAPPAAIRIAAFNFPESELIAEIYAQALEGRGIPVERLGRIGSREVVQPALELGLIDLVPEYAGTMLSFVSLGDNEPTFDSWATMSELREALEPRGVVVLEPANAQNHNSVIVMDGFASEHDVWAVSDLTALADTLTFGGPRECPERPFCLIGLHDVYGLDFETFIPMPGSAVVAASLRAGEIEVGVVFSTDSALVDTDLIVLDDDLGLQPAENVVPVIRADALARWGARVEDVLNEVSTRLDTSDLRLLNLRVEDPASDIGELAELWLAS